MRRNLRQNMRKDKAKNVKQIVFSMQSQDEEEVEVEAGEEEEEVEWELVEVSQGKTLPNWFRDINGTCRRSFAVDYFTGSPFLSLSPLALQFFTRLSHCARCFNLISCSPRTLFCFWCQLRSHFPPQPPLPSTPLAAHCPQVTVIDCCHWWKTLSTFLSPSLYVLLCLYLTLCCPQNALIVPHSQFSNGPSNLYIYITRDIPYS